MALNRNRDILLATATKESSYGGGATVDSLIAADLATIPQADPTIINDSDRLGASEEPTTQEIIALAHSMSFSQSRVKPHTLASIAVFGMGSVSSALADSGVPAVSTYKHEITPIADDDMPTTVAEMLIAAGIRRRYVGVGVNSFSLTGQRAANRAMDLSAELLISGNDGSGSGSATEKVEAAVNAAVTTGVYLGATTYTGPNDEVCDPATTDLDGSPTDIASSVQSFTWNYDNQISPDDQYRIGSGLFFGTMKRGTGRIQTVDLNWDYADETEYTRMKSQTVMAFQWKVRGALAEAGYYFGANLIIPKLMYQSHQVVEVNGTLMNQVTAQVMDDGTNPTAILVVFNEQAAYAA